MKKTIIVAALLLAPLFASASIDTNLQYGQQNSEVKQLQEFLAGKGFLDASYANGNFFSLTFKAVKDYQSSVGITPTGYVGPLTRESINNALSAASQSAGQNSGSNSPQTSTPAATASTTSLTSSQISAIVSLLKSFGASASTIANVQAALGGPPVSAPASTPTPAPAPTPTPVPSSAISQVTPSAISPTPIPITISNPLSVTISREVSTDQGILNEPGRISCASIDYTCSPYHFIATAKGGDGNYTYTWSGSCTSPNGNFCTASFSISGQKIIKVIVTDGSGNSASYALNLNVGSGS